MRKIAPSVLSLATLTLPVFASAASLVTVLQMVNNLANSFIGIFIVIAIAIFFWGLIMYLKSAGEEGAKGLLLMFYGVIAIFVMVSIWGLIALLQNTFGINPQNAALIPPLIPFR